MPLLRRAALLTAVFTALLLAAAPPCADASGGRGARSQRTSRARSRPTIAPRRTTRPKSAKNGGARTTTSRGNPVIQVARDLRARAAERPTEAPNESTAKPVEKREP